MQVIKNIIRESHFNITLSSGRIYLPTCKRTENTERAFILLVTKKSKILLTFNYPVSGIGE
jgi:hypothetical protein